MNLNEIINFKNAVQKELTEDILPFWCNHTIDKENGGFYGTVLNDLTIVDKANKGCILNSRILWSYSTAYRISKNENHLKLADIAYDFLVNHFWDKENSGLYWMVDYKGDVVDDRKQIYNIAFGIYGLSEYFRATGKKESLDKAIELYNITEKYSYDEINKGYIEALDKDWNIIQDMRLSPKNLNSKKSMNTHLHIMEAYTNLYRVWPDSGLKDKLDEIIDVTITHIIDANNYQFKLFFDETWNSLNKVISYGHDIEGSWLLYEAAEVSKNQTLIAKAKEIAIKMAEKVLVDGIDISNNSICSEKYENGTFEINKAWWPQAEAVVGFINAYQLTDEYNFLEAAAKVWTYIDKHFIDKKYGEWFNEVTPDGSPAKGMAKVDPWKCPYHNSRACFESIERLDKIIAKLGGKI